MSAPLVEQDDIAAAVEGARQGQTALRSLMLVLGDPDLIFNLLRPAFEEGAPYARARAIARTLQKHIEATL